MIMRVSVPVPEPQGTRLECSVVKSCVRAVFIVGV